MQISFINDGINLNSRNDELNNKTGAAYANIHGSVRSAAHSTGSADSRAVETGISAMAGSGLVVSLGQNMGMSAVGNDNGNANSDLSAALGASDVTLNRDYMSVMSLSMSDEDYGELVRTGQAPEDMEPKDSVTILDDIKTAIVKGGTNVAGYTDDVDQAALEQITGSVAAANSLLKSMHEQDVPVTDDNIAAAAEAVKTAQSVLPLSDTAVLNLLSGGMTPTVANVYRASYMQSSQGITGELSTGRNEGYYSDGGYQGRMAGDGSLQQLAPQIEAVVKASGIDDADRAEGEAEWLVRNGMPLTVETLGELDSLYSLRQGLSTQQITDAAAIAMSAGIPAEKANLTYDRSIYLQAEEYADELSQITDRAVDTAASEGVELSIRNLFRLSKTEDGSVSGSISGGTGTASGADSVLSSLEGLTSEQLHARQVLEEARLTMTVDANRMLLRSNFQIDTAPMEELIEALKQAKQSIDNRLFPAEDESVSTARGEMYRQVRSELTVIPTLPASLLGRTDENGNFVFDGEGTYSLNRVYEAGTADRDAYIKAGETYEALMTAPRADLGDSIRKAFRNTDDILEDMGLETDEGNRRAVRILGYNSMEITAENIAQIKEADTGLKDTLRKLTPSRVLSMIREDVNPMTLTVAELDDYLDRDSGSSDGSSQDRTENYARYLMQQERKGNITEEERTSYIGIYRMMDRLEKTDDAAVGRLVQMGSDISFSALLTAMRSMKNSGIDVSVSDDFTGIDSVRLTPAIDEQINTAYVKAAAAEISDRYAEAADMPDTVIEDLISTGQALTLDNMEAMNSIKTKRGDWLKPIADEYLAGLANAGRDEDETDEVLGEYVDARTLYDSYSDMLDSVRGSLTDLLTSDDEENVDIRAIHSSLAQISLLTALAGDETYDIPAQIDGETTAIRLKIKHDSGAGQLEVSLSTDTLGRVAAEFSFSGKPSGYIAYETEDAGSRLEGILEDVSSGLGFTPELIKADRLNLERYTDNFSDKNEDDAIKDEGRTSDINNTELYRAAKAFIGAVRKL